MRTSLVVVAVGLTLALAGPASAGEVPTPPDARLLGTVETNAIREAPDLKGARVNRNRDESLTGVRVLDQTWESDAGYRETARFYDRELAGALLIERDRSETASGWLVRLDDGTIASVILRNTQPTTIEIQRTVPGSITP
ncbi:MAG: hypothetical protein ACXVCV_15895 [Polyangia bacterium]